MSGTIKVETVSPIYDQIGIGYTSRRTADSRIFGLIQNLLSPCATVLNVGAGAGSYEPSTCQLAVEPSQQMIKQRVPGMAKCIRAVAEQLPLRDKSFDGALASLTLHHWSDVVVGLMEMRRVTRKRIVIFTWDPGFTGDFWLTRDYFPSILGLDRPRFPTLQQLSETLGRIEVHDVPIPADCCDGFTGAFWKRPRAYLDPEAQRSISALRQIAIPELHAGLAQLQDDLETGAWSQRNSSLETLNEIDLGYRLVTSDQA